MEQIKLLGKKRWQKGLKIAALVCLFFLLAYMRNNSPYKDGWLLYYIDGFWSLTIVCVSSLVISYIPILKDILAFLGKHSKNMFFVHAFFYLLFKDYMYSLKYVGIIYCGIVVLSLLLSLILELTKKVVKYDKLVNFVVMKVTENEKN